MSESLAKTMGFDRSGLETITAFHACTQLVSESYARADAGKRVSVADLFVEEGRQRLGADWLDGRAAIRDAMAARDVPGRQTLHRVTDVRYVDGSDVEVRLAYNLAVYEISGADPCVPSALASCDDTLVLSEGKWRLLVRDLTVHASRS